MATGGASAVSPKEVDAGRSGGVEGDDFVIPLPGGGIPGHKYKLDFTWEHFVIPDETVITFGGQTLLNTGLVGGREDEVYEFTVPASGAPPPLTITTASDDPQTGWYWTATLVDESTGPTANPDRKRLLDPAQPLVIPVLANDTPQGTLDPASIAIVSAPVYGTATTDGKGDIVYTENTDPAKAIPLNGSDFLTYTVKDQNGLVSNQANVVIATGDHDPSPLLVTGADFRANRGDFDEADGLTVDIGRTDGLASELTATGGELRIYDDKVMLVGARVALSGALKHPDGLLLNGDLTLQSSDGSSSVLTTSLPNGAAPDAGSYMSIAGLRYVAKSIKLLPGEVDLDGTLRLPDLLFGLTIGSFQLVDDATNGLHIASGYVTVPDAAARIFNELFVKASGVRITYNGTANALGLQGTFLIKSSTKVTGETAKDSDLPSVTATIADPNQITVVDGLPSLAGTLSIRNLDFCDWFGLDEITLTLNVSNGVLTSASFTGGLKFGKAEGLFASGSAGIKVSVSGGLVLNQDTGSLGIDSIGFVYQQDVPLPYGFFLHSFGGSLNGLSVYSSTPLGITGGPFEVSFGPKEQIDLPTIIVGDDFPAFDAAILDITLTGGIALSNTTSAFILSGSFDIWSLSPKLFDAKVSNASLDLGTGKGTLAFTGTILSIINAAGTITLDDGNVHEEGTASGTLPSSRALGILSGKSVSATFVGQASNDGDSSNDFFRISGSLPSILGRPVTYNVTVPVDPTAAGSASVQVYVGGRLFRFGGPGPDAASPQLAPASAPPASVSSAAADAPAASGFQVGGGSYLGLTLGYENAQDTPVPLEITYQAAAGGPVVTYTEDQFASIGAAYDDGLSSDYARTVIVMAPAAGTYGVQADPGRLDPGADLGDTTTDGFTDPNAPTLTWGDPSYQADQAGLHLLVPFHVDGSYGPVDVTFYLDEGTGYAGTEVAAEQVQPGDDTVLLSATGLPGDAVNLYAVISDASDPPAETGYAPFTADGLNGATDVGVTVDGGTVQPDGSIVYLVTTTNNGGETASGVVTQVSISDAGVTSGGAPDASGYDAGDQFLTIPIGILNGDGDSRVSTIRVTPEDGEASVGLSASVSTDTVDTDPADDGAATITTLPDMGDQSGADLSVSHVLPSTAGDRGSYSYGLLIRNAGPDAAAGVTVREVTGGSIAATQHLYTDEAFNGLSTVYTPVYRFEGGLADDIGSGTTYTDGTLSAHLAIDDTGALLVSLDQPLPSGGSFTVPLTVTPASPDDMTFQATVSSDAADPDPADDVASDSLAPPDLDTPPTPVYLPLSVQASAATVAAGDSFTATVALGADFGSLDIAAGVMVRITLSAGLAVGGSGSGYDGATGIWDAGTFHGNVQRDLLLDLTVTGDGPQTVAAELIAVDNGSRVPLGTGDPFDSTSASATIDTDDQPPVLAAALPAQFAVQGQAFSYTVPAGTFTDPDGDPVTFGPQDLAVSAPWLTWDAATGTLSGTPANADVTIGHDEPVTDPDVVTIVALDGKGGRTTTTLDINVANADDPPVAVGTVPDRTVVAGALLDWTLTGTPVSLPGALFDDPDISGGHDQGDSLSYTVDNRPDWLQFDGTTLTGTPADADDGSYALTLTAHDSAGETASIPFTLTVVTVPENPPVAAGPSPALPDATAGSDYSVTLPAGLFTDPDGDAISLRLGDDAPSWLTLDPATGVLSGSPPPGGASDASFTLLALDGKGGQATLPLALHVDAGGALPPVGTADSYTGDGSRSLAVDAADGVLANDTDPQGLPLSATLVTQATYGTVSLAADGSFTYVLGQFDRSTYGLYDSFTYQPGDGEASGQPVQVAIDMPPDTTEPPLHPPPPDQLARAGDPFTSQPLAGDRQDATSPFQTVTVKTLPSWLTRSGDVLTGTPDATDVGDNQVTVDYVAYSGAATEASFDVSVAPAGTQPAPLAHDDTFSGHGYVFADVLDNDASLGNAPLTAWLVDGVPPGEGTLNLYADGQFNYTVNPDDSEAQVFGPGSYQGSQVAFTYVADDGTQDSLPATVTLDLTDAPPTPPTLGGDTVAAHLPDGVPVGVVAATDPDDDAVSYSLADDAGGDFVLSGGTLMTAKPLSTGDVDVTVAATDLFGESTESTFAIHVVPDDSGGPVPEDDSLAAGSGTTHISDAFLLSNDTGPAPLSVLRVGTPGHGTLVPSGDGYDYTPDPGYAGMDGFEYTVADGDILSAAEVTVSDQPACYCGGTMILTPDGERPVESLAAGDLVMTARGPVKPVRWIGRRSYAGRFLRANPGVQPVRFRAGCLGAGLPRRDLLVSPDHAMFLDGALVPAWLLANGAAIVQERGLGQVDYYHVELDVHDVLLAEGAPSESFVDDDSRGMFHNADEWRRRSPGRKRVPPTFYAPRLESGPALDAIRRRLDEVAGLVARPA